MRGTVGGLLDSCFGRKAFGAGWGLLVEVDERREVVPVKVLMSKICDFLEKGERSKHDGDAAYVHRLMNEGGRRLGWPHRSGSKRTVDSCCGIERLYCVDARVTRRML